MNTVAQVACKPGDVLAAKYRVDRMLGVGGMGVVFAATHLHLQQPVALKFMLETVKTPEGVERFLREARAAVRLKSEHVARVLDVGTLDSGSPYMVMELLEGMDLGALLDQRHVLPVEEAVEYMLQVCDAIAEAHSKGIIHRDLKPANLFLTQGANGRAVIKVLDFGISKAITGPNDVSLTRTMAVMGSPFYMAPEQMKASRSADGRSDIWSLGIILYELLSGHPPFRGDSVTSLALAVVQDDPAPLSNVRIDVPPELERVIHRCLAKDRNNRYATASELAIALEPYRDRGKRTTGSQLRLSSTPPSDVGVPIRITPVSVPGRPEFEDTLAHSSAPTLAVPDKTPLSGPVIIRTGVTWGQTGPGRVLSVLWPAAALAVLIGVGLGGFFALRNRGEPKADVPPVPTSEVAVPTPVRTYRVEVDAVPATAAIDLDGELVARGRFARELPRDGRDHTLRISADGYVEQRLPFRDAPPDGKVTLAPVITAPAPPLDVRVKPTGGPERKTSTGGPRTAPRHAVAAPADSSPSTEGSAGRGPVGTRTGLSTPTIPSSAASPDPTAVSPPNGALIIH